MNRPGPTGMVILLAFAIPVVVEARTLFIMLGFDIAPRVYLPTSAVVLAVVFGAMWLFLDEGDTEGNLNKPA